MAADALERRSSPSRAWTLARNRGLLAQNRGNLAAAETSFQECISRGLELGTPEFESTGRFLLGSVLLAQGRYAEARSAFPDTDAKSFVGRFTTRVSALLLTGISHTAEGNFDLALQFFADARKACRSWSPQDLLARIDLETGLAYAGAGRTEEAVALFNQVAARLKDNEVFEASAQLAHFNGDLRRDLVEAVISIPSTDPASSLHLARSVLPRWQSNASTKDDFSENPQIIFFIGDHTSGRWTISDNTVHWTKLPGNRELRGMLAPVLADMSEPGRHIVEGDVQKLAKTLLSGVEDIWGTGQILTVVPDQSLFGVPWAALPLPGRNCILIDHGPIVILDMPTFATNSPGHHKPSGSLLVIGSNENASELTTGLSNLHFAEHEARDVASIWPVGQSVLRVGTNASKALTSNTDLTSFEAIHVASHARVFNGLSDQAMFLLAGEDKDAVKASTIRGLKISAELVFLSCCEAADGCDKLSGYSGLARSFLDAGARNLVAPLIVIDDEAARALATNFYRHWLAGQTVPDALRAAQQDLRRLGDSGNRWSHPFYWAFYQVIAADGLIMPGTKQ